ncbi:MAG: hypothetical protein ACREPM_20820 [Gemmatimonadaceae bacterium]
MGATSLKAFMHITRDELKASLKEGHKRGMKLLRSKAVLDRDTSTLTGTWYTTLSKLEVDFLRAGGTLLAGTDPTAAVG